MCSMHEHTSLYELCHEAWAESLGETDELAGYYFNKMSQENATFRLALAHNVELKI